MEFSVKEISLHVSFNFNSVSYIFLSNELGSAGSPYLDALNESAILCNLAVIIP